MKIPVQTLKKFANHASMIEANSILPILSYLYIGEGKIVKNNLKQFVSMEIDEDDGNEWLVEEKSLQAFLSSSSSEIELLKKDGRIFITDGETKMYSATDDPKHFPILPKHTGAGFNITADHCTSIAMASACPLPEDIMPQKCHVYVGNGIVFGSDGFVNFWDKCDLPNMVLAKNVANIIGKMDECYYRESETFHFIEHDNVVYGFAKDEAKYFDASQLLKFDSGVPQFQISRANLVTFNNLAIQQSREKDVACCLLVEDGVLKLSMNQSNYALDIEREYKVSGNDMVEFYYNPNYMNKILKACSNETVTILRISEHRIIIKGNENWNCLVMGIAKK